MRGTPPRRRVRLWEKRARVSLGPHYVLDSPSTHSTPDLLWCWRVTRGTVGSARWNEQDGITGGKASLRAERSLGRVPKHVLGDRPIQRDEQHPHAHRVNLYARNLRP